jgi:hypothetical protein
MQGRYDLFVRIYNSISPDFVLEEATPMTHKILENYYIETEYTEALLDITDVTWIDKKDYDGDGYSSSCKLDVKFACSEQDRSVDILVQTAPSGEKIYTTIDTVKTIELTDTISSKSILFDSTKLGQRDVYDLKLMVMFKDNQYIEDDFDIDDDSGLAGIRLESWENEIAIDSLLSFIDGPPFVGDPPYTTGPLEYACYAVRFDQPEGALLCWIEEVWIHIHEATYYNTISLKVWDDNENIPDHEVPSAFTIQRSVQTGKWNKYPINIDISAFNPFYVGYRQLRLGGPEVSMDPTSPHSRRSYKRDPVSGYWKIFKDQDIALKVLLKYFPGSTHH